MMKIFHLTYALSVIILLLLINNADVVAIQETNKIDKIKQSVKEIDLKMDKLTSDSTEIMNESTEGGIIISYKDGKYLVKIESQFYGEIGQTNETYYFSNQKLIYYCYSYMKYKELIISDKFEIENQFKVTYYIEKNQIIQKEYSDESIASKYEYINKSYIQIQNDIDNCLDIIKR